MKNRKPWLLLVLLLIAGAAAATVALSLGSRRAAMPGSGAVIGGLLIVCFGCWTYALLRYLRARDARRAVAVAEPSYLDSNLEGTVYGLLARAEYRVMQSFLDYYRNHFQEGELLHFKERHFLPYHGGHTIIFDERSLYLQEEENAEILANFSRYIARRG